MRVSGVQAGRHWYTPRRCLSGWWIWNGVKPCRRVMGSSMVTTSFHPSRRQLRRSPQPRARARESDTSASDESIQLFSGPESETRAADESLECAYSPSISASNARGQGATPDVASSILQRAPRQDVRAVRYRSHQIWPPHRCKTSEHLPTRSDSRMHYSIRRCFDTGLLLRKKARIIFQNHSPHDSGGR